MMKTFQFLLEADDSRVVRVEGTPSAPLFIAADICEVLGLSNSRKVCADLDDDEVASVTVSDTSSSTRNTITVSAVTESGLYHLIFKSRKPAAKKFRRWVTEEVLPEIRKTGQFQIKGGVREPVETMIAPVWLESLGFDLSENATECQWLLERVNAAARCLRFNTASFRIADGFQAIPVPVLKMAEGFYLRDQAAPPNRHLFVTVPRLAVVG